MRVLPAAAVLLLSAATAAAQAVNRETFEVLGFNDSCSVALAHYGYPALGDALYEEPVRTRIGTLTIPPGRQKAEADWIVDWDGELTWQKDAAQKALAYLKAVGYTKPPFVESIRPAPAEPPPGLAQTLFSTSTFALRSTAGWPAAGWRWDQVLYSPVGDCALFIFTRPPDQPFYKYLLLRTYNPSARGVRTRAHLSDSRVLMKYSDLAGALAEAAIAARMSPSDGAARYRHAAMLCLSGHLLEALAELGEAIRLDPKNKARARPDPDFDTLRGSAAFEAAVGGSR